MPVNLEPIKAVILAGGAGTRVQHLLSGIPKPMAPVAGKPFVEWVVRFLAKHGITDVTISSGYLAGHIAAHFDCFDLPGVSVRCRPEPQPLGTAGGFLNAIDGRHDEPGSWLVCNGDSLILADLRRMLSMAAEFEAVLLGVDVADCSRFGSLQVDSSDRLQRFVEKRPGEGLISAGVYLINQSLPLRFPADRPLSFETDVFPFLLKSGIRMGVNCSSAPFLDIGTEATLRLASDFVSSHGECFL